ncbi:MAG: serine/threonine protein kinase [Rhodothermales bacterium]|jgi:serine/threonine protein kinase
MSWPRATDYQEAMQFPAVSLCDPNLAGMQVDSGPLGLPRAISGNFASVYQIERDSQRWALRCFLGPSDDRQDRYHIIARHLAKRCPACLSSFDFLPEGLLVHGQRFPALRMPWVEGRTLSSWISEQIKNPAAIAALEPRWIELLRSLKRARIAHGDLQHGNIIVCPDGSLRLIDYDGMWVPGLSGRFATELGHPNYQAPSRDACQFHGELDSFSGRLIHISLRAIALRPQLWNRFHNEGNLIFTREDLLAPEASPLFAEIAGLGDKTLDREIALLVRELRKATSPALRETKPKLTPLRIAFGLAALLLIGLAIWPDAPVTVDIIPPIPSPVQAPPPAIPKSPDQLAAETRAKNFHSAYARADQGFLKTYAADTLARLERSIAAAEARAAAEEWQAASSTWDNSVAILADAISAAVANSARIAPPVSRPRPQLPEPVESPAAKAANAAADAYETLLAEIGKDKLSGAPWYFAQQTAQAAEVAHSAGNHSVAAKKWQDATKMVHALAPQN